jgi:hypothetical protein
MERQCGHRYSDGCGQPASILPTVTAPPGSSSSEARLQGQAVSCRGVRRRAAKVLQWLTGLIARSSASPKPIHSSQNGNSSLNFAAKHLVTGGRYNLRSIIDRITTTQTAFSIMGWTALPSTANQQVPGSSPGRGVTNRALQSLKRNEPAVRAYPFFPSLTPKPSDAPSKTSHQRLTGAQTTLPKPGTRSAQLTAGRGASIPCEGQGRLPQDACSSAGMAARRYCDEAGRGGTIMEAAWLWPCRRVRRCPPLRCAARVDKAQGAG